MLIEEYFQQIETEIANCPSISEYSLIKDKRSLYIGIIEGKIYFINESVLYFLEFINVKEKIERYKYSYHYQDKYGRLIFSLIWLPITENLKPFPIINI